MPSNDQRADWADQALTAFQKTTGCDRQDALSDLLCDLMHLARREGWDYYRAAMRAEGHFEEEFNNPEPEDVFPRPRPFVVRRAPT